MRYTLSNAWSLLASYTMHLPVLVHHMNNKCQHNNFRCASTPMHGLWCWLINIQLSSLNPVCWGLHIWEKLVAASAYIWHSPAFSSVLATHTPPSFGPMHVLSCWLHIHLLSLPQSQGRHSSQPPAWSLILATHQTFISALVPHILFCVSYTCSSVRCWLSNPTLFPVL